MHGEEGESAENLNSFRFYKKNWCVFLKPDRISYYSAANELTVEKDQNNDSILKFIQLYGYKKNSTYKNNEKEKGSCDCVIICDDKKITTICNPGKYDNTEAIKDFEYEDGIDSVDDHYNYIVVNGSDVILIMDEYIKDIKLTYIKNIKNMKQVNVGFISESDFIKNVNGEYFCIAGLTEQQKLQLYNEQGFTSLYKELSTEIAEREKKEKEEKQKKIKNDKELSEYVKSKDELLVPVVFSNPDFHNDDLMHGASIYDASTKNSTGSYYYSDNPDVQALYGIQESGWRGHAYRGMIINVEKAKESVDKKGNLNLYIPDGTQGKIIGTGGMNIKFVKNQLRKKGVHFRDIKLVPVKVKDDPNDDLPKITLDIMKAAIQRHKREKSIS